MNPHSDMDLTRYLQTEGRRLAAERMRRPKSSEPACASRVPAQQQSAAPDDAPAPRSLSEALQRMGVVTGKTRS